MKSFLRNQSTSGMTILEVIAVVTIIGILAAIAAPSWVAFANRQRSNRAADQVLQAIRSSQSDAKRMRRTRTLEFSEGTDTAAPTINQNGIVSSIGEGDLEGFAQLRVFENVTFDGNGDATGGDEITDQAISFTSTGGLEGVNLPVHITVAVPRDGEGAKKCIEIRSLLGATQTAKDAECAF